MANEALERVVCEATRRVAELPDRTSLDDWPESLIVTTEELPTITRAACRDVLQAFAEVLKENAVPNGLLCGDIDDELAKWLND